MIPATQHLFGQALKELALDHPAYGCNRFEALLRLEGRRVSAITIDDA